MAEVSCVMSLEIGSCLWLIFLGSRFPVVWSWSMGWARLGAQGDLGVLSESGVWGVLVVVVHVVCGDVPFLCLSEWG